MTSSINPLYPEEGAATTLSVRNNFQAAKDEIEALQTMLINPYQIDYLIHAEGANNSTVFTNSANAGDLVGVGTAKISTTKAKFGNSSIYCDGSGARVKTNDVKFINYTTNDFTIEMFVNLSALSGYQYLFTRTETGVYGGGYGVYTNGNTLKIDLSTNNENYNVFNGVGTGILTANTWHHVALVRLMGTFFLFLDGILTATQINTQTMLSSTIPLNIGARNNATYPTSGYFDEIRISRAAIYTQNFTPPIAPFVF